MPAGHDRPGWLHAGGWVIAVAERLDTIPITCHLDRQAHDVTDDNVATGRATGAYEAVCGYVVVENCA